MPFYLLIRNILKSAYSLLLKLVIKIYRKLNKQKFSDSLNGRLLYIDHSFHQRTRSTSFFIDILRSCFTVDCLYDNSWCDGTGIELEQVISLHDIFVFFQIAPSKREIQLLKGKPVFFVPMYDDISDDPRLWWRLKNLRIISFSTNISSFLSKLFIDYLPVQYFPEPKEYNPGDFKKAFFWQRNEKINLSVVNKLIGGQIQSLHHHVSLDPGQKYTDEHETEIDIKKVIKTSWFEDKKDMEDLMNTCGVYIAPREKEGIGMSFLEAMASGKVVIAPNQATMNEYIIQYENGFIYDIYDPQCINLDSLESVSMSAYKSIVNGYEKWKKDIVSIQDYITNKRLK